MFWYTAIGAFLSKVLAVFRLIVLFKMLLWLIKGVLSGSNNPVNLTIQIRLRFKNFHDLGFRLDFSLLNYKGYGSVWV